MIVAMDLLTEYPPVPAEVERWQHLCNGSDETDPRIQKIHWVAYGIIAPTIISVGTFGNLLTMFILRLPQFRGVTYTYFLTLAVSDFVSLVFSISVFFRLTHNLTPSYSTAVWYSYFEIFFANMFLSASNFIVICVTVERFFSVCRPADFKTIHTKRFAKRMICGAFLLAVIVWLPTCFVKTPREYYNCGCSYAPLHTKDSRTWWVACLEIPKLPTTLWYFIYTWVRQTITNFIPTIVLVTLNSLTLREFLRVRRKRLQWMEKSFGVATGIGVSRQEFQGRYQSDQNLIHLLAAVIVSFVVTMVPVGIYNALHSSARLNSFSFQVFRAIANNLEILDHAMNFYLYILCSRPIRVALKDMFIPKHKVSMQDIAVD